MPRKSAMKKKTTKDPLVDFPPKEPKRSKDTKPIIDLDALTGDIIWGPKNA